MKGNCKFFSVICVKRKQSVSSITLSYSSTFYSLCLPFFVLEIFKFKYDKFFIRHSASISKFKWFEQLCFKIALLLRDWQVFMWQSLEMLNIFNTLKPVLSKRKTFFKKLEYCSLVESIYPMQCCSNTDFH